MAKKERKSTRNLGCLIVVILLVLGYLIYYFYTTSPQDIYSSGVSVIGIMITICVYFLVKYILNRTKITTPTNDTEKTNYDTQKTDTHIRTEHSKLGCTLSLIIIIGGIALYTYIEKNGGSLPYAVGVNFAIGFAITIGVLIYDNFKEK